MAITKKTLTPAKFGLNTMRPLSSKNIQSAVNSSLGSLSVTPAAKEAMKHMIDQAVSGTKTATAKFDSLTGADIGSLTSDFGEVTGAIYKLNSGEGYTAAKFPVTEGNALVDYYLVKNGLEFPFSAKAQGGGGAPSIGNLEKKISELSDNAIYKDQKRKKALKVLKMIAENSAYDGPLLIAQYLGLASYDSLVSLLKRKDLNTGYTSGIPTQEHLKAAIDACGSFDSCMEEFKSYHDDCNFQLGKEQKMREVFAGTAGRRYKSWGLLHYPITSSVLKWLKDSDNRAKEVLNDIANTLSITQINLNHTPKLMGNAKWQKGSLVYSESHFSVGTFTFHAPTSAPNPIGNKIGFTME